MLDGALRANRLKRECPSLEFHPVNTRRLRFRQEDRTGMTVFQQVLWMLIKFRLLGKPPQAAGIIPREPYSLCGCIWKSIVAASACIFGRLSGGR
jgi:hypothetical protein